MSAFSVLLSIYAKEKVEYFDQSMTSIWDHQALKPDQIVLVQDGPLTAELESIIGDWKLKLKDVLDIVVLKENMGLAKALNFGLKVCKHDLVARMDTDDLALPDRFSEQVNYMNENPATSVLSSYIEECSEDLSEIFSVKTLPVEHAEILSFSKKRCPMAHPAVLYRKSDVLSVNGYPDFKNAQDYALWAAMLVKGYTFENLPKVLLKMRAGDNMFSRRGWAHYKNEYKVISFQRRLGFLSNMEFLRNISLRFILRIAPLGVKKFIYSKFR